MPDMKIYKDIQVVLDVIERMPDPANRGMVAIAFDLYFRKINPQFDSSKFQRAVACLPSFPSEKANRELSTICCHCKNTYKDHSDGNAFCPIIKNGELIGWRNSHFEAKTPLKLKGLDWQNRHDDE